MAGHQAAAVNTGPETQEIQPDGDPKTPRDEQSATDPGSNSAADRSSEPSLGPATDPNSSPNPNPEPAREPAPALAPLTPQEFRIYNRLAEQMEYFVIPLPPVPLYLPPILSLRSPHLDSITS